MISHPLELTLCTHSEHTQFEKTGLLEASVSIDFKFLAIIMYLLDTLLEASKHYFLIFFNKIFIEIVFLEFFKFLKKYPDLAFFTRALIP